MKLGVENLEGVEGGKNMIKIHCMKSNLFKNNKKKSLKQSTGKTTKYC